MAQKFRQRCKANNWPKKRQCEILLAYSIKEAPAELLKNEFSGPTREMFKNEMQNAKRKCRGHHYNEDV